MENIKHKTHRQIIFNFYQNHQAKGKPYIVSNFAKMQLGRHQVYRAIERYESGASHQCQGKKGQPRKLTRDQEKKVIKAMEERVLAARYPWLQIPHFNSHESISLVISNCILLVFTLD